MKCQFDVGMKRGSQENTEWERESSRGHCERARDADQELIWDLQKTVLDQAVQIQQLRSDQKDLRAAWDWQESTIRRLERDIAYRKDQDMQAEERWEKDRLHWDDREELMNKVWAEQEERSLEVKAERDQALEELRELKRRLSHGASTESV